MAYGWQQGTDLPAARWQAVRGVCKREYSFAGKDPEWGVSDPNQGCEKGPVCQGSLRRTNALLGFDFGLVVAFGRRRLHAFLLLFFVFVENNVLNALSHIVVDGVGDVLVGAVLAFAAGH